MFRLSSLLSYLLIFALAACVLSAPHASEIHFSTKHRDKGETHRTFIHRNPAHGEVRFIRERLEPWKNEYHMHYETCDNKIFTFHVITNAPEARSLSDADRTLNKLIDRIYGKENPAEPGRPTAQYTTMPNCRREPPPQPEPVTPAFREEWRYSHELGYFRVQTTEASGSSSQPRPTYDPVSNMLWDPVHGWIQTQTYRPESSSSRTEPSRRVAQLRHDQYGRPYYVEDWTVDPPKQKKKGRGGRG
ncbi:hypothetical protein ANO11243_050370 [Dothideomycetidae sp. 11243]|nr:hypothetical protein ANO11243_050370 [fungal sp. No.11243]